MWMEECRDLICGMENAAKNMYRLRYQMSNGGNLSVRVPQQELMIVKKTDVAFDEVNRDNLVVTDFDGNVVEGTGFQGGPAARGDLQSHPGSRRRHTLSFSLRDRVGGASRQPGILHASRRAQIPRRRTGFRHAFLCGAKGILPGNHLVS